MEFLKALFSNGPLTFEQFEAAVKEQKMNIVNLADGGYVSKSKYDDTVNGLKGQVTELQGQITSRDGDLTSLREQLTAAQADAGKLGAVQQSLADLQTKYNTDKTDYENKLTRQAYEYMVRERANSLQFSSASAKKAFLQEAIGKDFKVDGESLLGYEDFVTKYKADDPGAFAAEKERPRLRAPGTGVRKAQSFVPVQRGAVAAPVKTVCGWFWVPFATKRYQYVFSAKGSRKHSTLL